MSILLCATAAAADWTRVMAESNLERRSKAALEAGENSLEKARHAYRQSDLKTTEAELAEVAKGVEIAQTSLKDSGKNPRKNPKYFKNAEVRTREILKRLSALDHEMDFADRALVQPVKEKIQRAHDGFLHDVMSKKK
ncbi:MAG: hypothetical protein ACRD8O_17825 [Bryobacteraceae bacterium]